MMSIGKKTGLHDKFIEAKAVGDYSLTLQLIEELLILHPKTGGYHFGKGVLLEENFKRYREAINCYKQVVKYRPNNTKYHVTLAASYNNVGKQELALRSLEDALKIDSKCISALTGKAIILRRRAEHEQALIILDECLSLDLNVTGLLNEKCLNLIVLGRYEEAKETISKIEEINPKYQLINWLKGSLSYSASKYKEAIDHFSLARKKDCLSELVLVELLEKQANSHKYLEEYNKAIDCYNEYQQYVARSRRSELDKLGLGYRDNKDTSTSSSANVSFELAGSGIKTGVSASNSESMSSKEMSAAERRAYNESFEKLKNAARMNNINSTSDEVKSLTRGISNNWNE
ncbi:MAG: hypothetical protein RCG15_00655 [Candidatus Rickettsia vulgarisii]